MLADKLISAYFLIVWDFVNWARQRGIPANARGSGVGVGGATGPGPAGKPGLGPAGGGATTRPGGSRAGPRRGRCRQDAAGSDRGPAGTSPVER
ncbi:MAG: hypothetical protein ACK4M0_16115 [Phreatobacter sp.]